MGGNLALHKFLAHSVYLKHIDSIRKTCTFFFDQLLSPDGLYLIKWDDRRLHLYIRNKVPAWFTNLEKRLLTNVKTFCRIHVHFQAGVIPPAPNTEIIFTDNFAHNCWTYSWLLEGNCLVIGKILKSINDHVIIEHWNQILSSDPDISPSATHLNIQRCTECHHNSNATFDLRWLPKNCPTPNCIIFIEKQAALKLLLVKKLGDTMTVNFSQFLLEQTARHRYFTPILRNTVLTTPVLSSSSNHTLLNKFITSPYYHSSLLQLSVAFNDSLTSIFYTNGSIDTPGQKAGAAWIETSHNINFSFHANIHFS
jgi:hypothetical protein